MAGRRIGVAMLIADADQGFKCPPIPERLIVPAVDPLNPDPPEDA